MNVIRPRPCVALGPQQLPNRDAGIFSKMNLRCMKVYNSDVFNRIVHRDGIEGVTPSARYDPGGQRVKVLVAL